MTRYMPTLPTFATRYKYLVLHVASGRIPPACLSDPCVYVGGSSGAVVPRARCCDADTCCGPGTTPTFRGGLSARGSAELSLTTPTQFFVVRRNPSSERNGAVVPDVYDCTRGITARRLFRLQSESMRKKPPVVRTCYKIHWFISYANCAILWRFPAGFFQRSRQ